MSTPFSHFFTKINQISPLESDFTEVLEAIALKPKMLYFYGKMPKNVSKGSKAERPKSVAIVGSRKNTTYGKEVAYKMAYTDALSIACKALGFSHDIYYQKDRTKYTALSSDDAPAAEVNTTEIVSRIQKGINFLTKDMNNEQKDKFVMDVVVPKIGNPNYMACKDVVKLQALLDTLLTMSKAKAA